MQRLAPEGGERRLAPGTEMAGLGFEMRTIEGIAHQGVADVGKMHPDLMGAPGLELTGQQRGDGFAVAAVERLL